jgi:methylenetetrahydrofolate reductase (NADPH)
MTNFSVEISPGSKTTIADLLDSLMNIQPDLVSITCRVKNSSSINDTLALANAVQNQCHMSAMPHLTALYLTHEKAQEVITQLTAQKINHVLALRGDLRPDMIQNDFSSAGELIKFIKNKQPEIQISGVCQPEQLDLSNLRTKIAGGCTSLITQIFYDNAAFYHLQSTCQQAGLNAPIIAGIMPITSYQQAQRIRQLGQISIPNKLKQILEKYRFDAAALKQASLDYTLRQVSDLIDHQVAGIHVFTMNDLTAAAAIKHDFNFT